jgi:N-acetylglutamate synthase-like GNAT family acetyltransferase
MNEIRPAVYADVPGIVTLVSEHARRGDLLPRTAAAVEQTVAEWYVAVLGGQVAGCGSLQVYGPHLAEIRSLAVHDGAKGQGWGAALVQALVSEARRRQIPRLFALTRAVPFFERCGFSATNRFLIPEKVWRDCRACPLQQRCDETAMVLDLTPAHVETGMQGQRRRGLRDLGISSWALDPQLEVFNPDNPPT